MRDRVNTYGPVITGALRLGAQRKPMSSTDGLVFYGYYEYTGFRGMWRKIKLGIRHRINEH